MSEVIDNASFHRSQTIDGIVAEAGCELRYLPPYSPDLNRTRALVVCTEALDEATVG